MAATKIQGGNVRGGTVNTEQWPIKPGETFQIGDFLYLSSTGAQLTVAAGNNFSTPAGNTTYVLGRAESPAVDPNTNAINPFVTVTMAQPGTQFKVPLYSATAASAVPTITFIGTAYIMRQVTAWNGPGINIDTTTNPTARIVDFDDPDFSQWPGGVGPGTTQYANVWIEFLASASLCTGAR